MDTGGGDKSNADNDLYLPQTDSFWEIGKYNRAVKRCDDGNKLTTDLISMINERAEVEKAFSKMLKSWSKKWSDYVAKSPEFGSMTTAWKAIMGEADASAEVHQTVHDELQNDLIPAIKSWQKTKYVKSMMHIKPTKDLDDEFKRAQKPWAKHYAKVDKYKREYHTATKNLKMAEAQENNSKLDGAVLQDQRAKLSEKVERCRKEKEAVKGKYAEALQEINRANPKYMDDMNEVFSRCQTFEKDRLMKFREFLGATEKCLDLTSRLQSANFQQFSHTIKSCDPDRDLSWWSDTYGAGMKMNWPTFEESTNLDDHHQQQNQFSYCANDLSMGYDAYHRRQLAHFVSQTGAAVAYDTRILVVDSYATIRRSMRRTAAVVTRVRRDLSKREEYSEAQRTLSRRAKGDIEKENPVVVTAIRSNNNGPSGVAPVDNRLSTNNAAFNEENDSAPASPYMGYHQPVSAPADASPGWAANSWANDSYAAATNNGSNSSLPSYQTNSISSYQNQSSYPPQPANPFYEEDDMNNGDSSSSSHQHAHQSPTSGGGMSFDSSAGIHVRALYDYEAQEQDELSFKQGDIFTKLEDEDDQGWCRGRVGGRVGLYPATYVEGL